MTDERKPGMPSIFGDFINGLDKDFGDETECEFPMPKIEIIASDALGKLDVLAETLGDEELEKVPDSHDTRVNIRKNDLFVREQIVPIVDVLMMRTMRRLRIGEEADVGYIFIDPDYEMGVIGIYFSIDDEEDEYWGILDTAEDVQSAWEETRPEVRNDLLSFSLLSKREIIDKFTEYTLEYL